MANVGHPAANGDQQHTPFADLVTYLPEWIQSFKSSGRGDTYSGMATSSHDEQFKLIDRFLEESALSSSIMKAVQHPTISRGKSELEATNARKEGNQLFAERKWQKALDKYNRSLCLAPVHDPESGEPSLSLALAYGNRSAVYFNQGRHLECVLDVQLAVKHGYSQDKVEKLLVRMAKSYMAMQHYAEAVDSLEKCLGAQNDPLEAGQLLHLAKNCLEKQKASGKMAPVMTFHRPNRPMYMGTAATVSLAGGQHAYFPSASALVGTTKTRTWGKHFVAEADIEAGNVLLKESSFVNAVMERASQTNCRACSAWTDNPTPCNECSNGVFCSLECASGAKAELHAKECSQLWTFGAVGDQRGNDGAIAFQGLLMCAYRILLMKSLEEWISIAEKLSNEPDEEKSKLLSELLPNKVYNFADIKPTSVDEQILCGFGAWFVVTVLRTTEGYQGTDAKMRNFFGGLALRHLRAFSWHVRETVDCVVHVPSSRDLTSVCTGYALYPSISLFPGSCAPNVAAAMFGDLLVLRAIRSIKKGEMLTLQKHKSMDHVSVPKEKRQVSSLLSMLLPGGPSHSCNCIVCKNAWPMTKNKGFEGPGKALCKKCSKLCEVTTDDINKGRYRCGSCGFTTVPGCFPKIDQLRQFAVDGRRFSTEEELDYLLELCREASKCLVEPNAMLDGMRQTVARVWGIQGNKRLMLDY